MAKNRGVRKPRQRTIDRINLLVRLELANPLMNSTQVAELCGLSINQFSVLKKTREYQAIHNVYTTGVYSNLDVKVRDIYNNAQNTLEIAVPMAMQEIFKQALNAKDERVRNKACNDILDRDGHFAKVSRIGMATTEQGGVADDKDNKAVLEMMNALRSSHVNGGAASAAPSIASPPLTDRTQ